MASVRCVDAGMGYSSSNGFTVPGTGATNIPVQANYIRNLIEGADLVMSHILHFYHLAALDYINTDSSMLSGVAPWGNGKDNTSDMVSNPTADVLVGHYVQALNIRRKAHEFAAHMSGKQPCQPCFTPGGVTNAVITTTLTGNLMTLLGDNTSLAASNSGTNIRSFIKYVYIPDVKTVAAAFSSQLLYTGTETDAGSGCARYLAYGSFPDSSGVPYLSSGFLDATAANTASWTLSPLDPSLITESVKYSKYDDSCEGLHPSAGSTQPSPNKSGAYSWIKAPRYNGHSAEVGPLARVLVNAWSAALGNNGTQHWLTAVVSFLGSVGLNTNHIPALRSVLGRHAARAIECDVIADKMVNWINALQTTSATGETYRHREIPRTGSGYGLTEAPRGALGHWITIEGKKIANYQCVVPTTWNARPRDVNEEVGPIEKALEGIQLPNDTESASARVKVGRIVRSFDPCIACAVHIVYPDKNKVVKFELPTLPSK